MHDLAGYRSLNALGDKVDESFVREQLSGYYHLESVGLSRIVTEKDDTFSVSLHEGDNPEFIFKIENIAESRRVVQTRIQALQRIERHIPTIPSTRAVPAANGEFFIPCETDAGARWGTLTTFIPGGLLSSQRKPYSTIVLNDVGRRLAQIQDALSAMGPQARSAGHVLWDVRLLPELADDLSGLLADSHARTLIAQVVRDYEAIADRLQRLAQSLCHGDFHPNNIIVSDDCQKVVGIIDFGDMHAMPAVCDLGTCLFYYIDERAAKPLEGCRHVLNGYLSMNRTFDGGLIPLLPIIMKARCVLTILLPLLMCKASPERGGHFPAQISKRVRQLEFLEPLNDTQIIEALTAAAPQTVAKESQG